MKTFKTISMAAIALTILSFAACKKSGSSPKAGNSQLSFQMQADNAINSLAATSTGSTLASNSTSQGIAGLTFTSAVANISRFKFEAKRNNVEIEITSKNLTHVDLFALSPLLTSITLDTGTYKEIEIRAELQHTPDTGALPLKLKGTFAPAGGAAIPFEFDLNDDVTIKAEAENIAVTNSTDFVALLHLHLLRLESGISAADLQAATISNGVIVISRTSNSSIYDRILANVGNCAENEFREHQKDGHDDNGNDGSGQH